LVEGYRTRLWEQLHSPQQQQLPGFEYDVNDRNVLVDRRAA